MATSFTIPGGYVFMFLPAFKTGIGFGTTTAREGNQTARNPRAIWIFGISSCILQPHLGDVLHNIGQKRLSHLF